MKVRIVENNMTLRLEKSDLDDLKNAGIIQSHISFPNRTLFLYLETIDIPEIQGDFTEEGIQIYLPTEELEALLNTRRVGFTNTQGDITITVEKNLPKRKK